MAASALRSPDELGSGSAAVGLLLNEGLEFLEMVSLAGCPIKRAAQSCHSRRAVQALPSGAKCGAGFATRLARRRGGARARNGSVAMGRQIAARVVRGASAESRPQPSRMPDGTRCRARRGNVRLSVLWWAGLARARARRGREGQGAGHHPARASSHSRSPFVQSPTRSA